VQLLHISRHLDRAGVGRTPPARSRGGVGDLHWLCVSSVTILHAGTSIMQSPGRLRGRYRLGRQTYCGAMPRSAAGVDVGGLPRLSYRAQQGARSPELADGASQPARHPRWPTKRSEDWCGSVFACGRSRVYRVAGVWTRTFLVCASIHPHGGT
jgi:hypothetical protein